MRRNWIILVLLAARASAANWYVDAAATGSHNGTSWANAWTSFAQITQASLAGDDVVYIKSGTYNERFTLSKSGTSGHSIIYVGSGTTKPVLRGVNFSTFSDISVLGLEIDQAGSSSYGYNMMDANGGVRLLMQGNYLHDPGYSGTTCNGGIRIRAGSQNCVIRGNTIDLPTPSGATGSGAFGVQVQLDDSYNLVEYNTFGRGNDKVSNNSGATWNVVRNNYMGPMLTADLQGKTDPHVDNLQLQNATAAGMVLIDRNFSNQNDTANGHGFFLNNASGLTTTVMIGRFNVLSKTGSLSFQYITAEALMYNNTDVDGQNQGSPKNLYAYSATGTNDVWLNDSITRSARSTSTSEAIFYSSGSPSVCDYNAIYGGGILGRGTHNVSANPLFTNESTLDFTLQSGSPLKAAGGALTTASGSGSGSTSLTVADARGLFDGWGIADADFIKIGSGSYVQISSINYGTNVVTLAAARTWSNGDAVIVKGMEDVGALPYSYALSLDAATTSTVLFPAGSKTLSAAVTNTVACRFVEFLIDGIPVGTDFTSPYSTSWTSDGAKHYLTTRSYNYWASTTPTVEQVRTTDNPTMGSPSALSASSVNVPWTDNSGGTSTFSVEVSLHSADSWTVAGTTPAGAVSLGITGLTPSTQYDFRVRAYDGTYYSVYSATGTATTSVPGVTTNGTNPSRAGIGL